VQPFAAVSTTLASVQSVPTRSLAQTLLVAAWVCGLVVVVSIRVRAWRRVRRALLASTTIDPSEVRSTIPVRVSTDRLGPGVVGVWRPVLVLPPGIATRLTADQLAAVVAHERCHVTRRDNLTALLHMAVEAAVWFHPLVWWIGARLVDERERACDEEVLHGGGDPRVYADAILNVCRLYSEPPLACVAGVTGSDLKRRLAAIFARTARDVSLPRKMLLACACAVVTLGPLAVGMMETAVRAQSTPAPSSPAIQFEVVSIRPIAPYARIWPMVPHFDGGRWMAPRITADWLIRLAFDVKESQIVGLPAWVEDATYTIEAKLPPNTGEKDLPQMFQGLLADRFGLVSHREIKMMKVRTITIAKQGLKLKPATATCTTDPAEDRKPLLERRRCGEMVMSASPNNYRYGIVYRGFSVSMADLATFFNGEESPEFFVDGTGLKGLYDVEVALDLTPPPDLAAGSDDITAFRQAIRHKGWQDQAGLVLDIRQDRPIPVFVVDHLERPKPNAPAAVQK
jgi:uncharacterized protein (TIGR03435 family)